MSKRTFHPSVKMWEERAPCIVPLTNDHCIWTLSNPCGCVLEGGNWEQGTTLGAQLSSLFLVLEDRAASLLWRTETFSVPGSRTGRDYNRRKFSWIMELPIFLSLVSQTKQVMDGHILSAGVLRLCLCEPPVPARCSLTGGKGYRSGLQAASACWHWFVLRTRLLH